MSGATPAISLIRPVLITISSIPNKITCSIPNKITCFIHIFIQNGKTMQNVFFNILFTQPKENNAQTQN